MSIQSMVYSVVFMLIKQRDSKNYFKITSYTLTLSGKLNECIKGENVDFVYDFFLYCLRILYSNMQI